MISGRAVVVSPQHVSQHDVLAPAHPGVLAQPASTTKPRLLVGAQRGGVTRDVLHMDAAQSNPDVRRADAVELQIPGG